MQRNNPDFEIVGVGLDGRNDDLLAFIEKGGVQKINHISGHLEFEKANTLANELNVRIFPTFVFMHADGTQTTRNDFDAEAVQALIDAS